MILSLFLNFIRILWKLIGMTIEDPRIKLCPYRIGERVRALKLLRSVSESMLLMWDRGLHSYRMVNTTLAQGCQYLVRVPANIKFPAHT